jgi:hypothetical protein
MKLVTQTKGSTMRKLHPIDVKLPYPMRLLKIQGAQVQEYVIPDDKKLEVLNLLYPFTPVPSLDEELLDIHEDKTFIVRDYRVTWENGHNWLVSPYYPSGGGTVIDWMPLDAKGETD